MKRLSLQAYVYAAFFCIGGGVAAFVPMPAFSQISSPSLGGTAPNDYICWTSNRTYPGIGGLVSVPYPCNKLPDPPYEQTLEEILQGQSTLPPGGIGPGGNIELFASSESLDNTAFEAYTGETCLSGDIAGEAVTWCSLTAADWASGGFGRYWFADILARYSVTPTDFEAAYNAFLFYRGRQIFSDANIAYAYVNGSGQLVTALAGFLNAAPYFVALLPPGTSVPAIVQISELVKVHWRNTDAILYAAGPDSATDSGQTAPNDPPNNPCPPIFPNPSPPPAYYFGTRDNCSYSGNFEIPISGPPDSPILDYGDAPDSYGTSNANNGPRHVLGSGLIMGNVVDSNPDGVPSVNADGDNDTGPTPDDEEGVNPASLVFTEGRRARVSVQVNNPFAIDATLKGWIDFNGNGVFDSGESAETTVPAGFVGSVTLNFGIVPAGSVAATGGTTYARFRISTDAESVDSPTTPADGLPAPDGEVEDYVTKIRARPTPSPPGAPIHPLTVWLTMLGLAFTTVFYRRRQDRR